MITEFLEKTLNLAEAIYRQAKLVGRNRQGALRLAEKVAVVQASTRGLGALPENQRFIDALGKINSTLEQALALLEFLAPPAPAKGWFADKRKKLTKKIADFINASENEQALNYIGIELQQDMLQLDLAINAQTAELHQIDAAKADKKQMRLLSNQKDLLVLNDRMLSRLDEFKGEQEDRHQLLLALLESVHHHYPVNSTEQKADKNPDLSRLSIPFHELSFTRVLSKPSSEHFGTLYEGFYREQPVVIKRFDGQLTEAEQLQFLREAQIMSRLRSPYINACYGACLEPGYACLVMGYVPAGNLSNVLANRALTSREQHHLALTLARGLYYLHSEKMYHRALTPQSLLVGQGGEALISYLGDAKSEQASVATVAMPMQPKASTLRYIAPETLSQPLRTASDWIAADIYSYGRILETLFIPAENESKSDTSSLLPTFYRDLIDACCNTSPAARPSLKDIISKLKTYTVPTESAALIPRKLSLNSQGREWYVMATSKLETEPATAFALFTQSAEAGYLKAQSYLGTHYLKRKETARALPWLEKAAEKGHPKAQLNLGLLYVHGDGIPKNIRKGVTFFEKAKMQNEDPTTREKAAAQYAQYASQCEPEASYATSVEAVTAALK